MRTLQVFLDEQGSVTRTAHRLHLHRNAVAYRIGRIKDVLQVDADDPDTRLALQLACRARLLA
ncbi:MAG: helix-turn-helix domain-containing protein [Planctomycetaceae bacterium]